MSIDINSLSTKELELLISHARKRKTTLSKRKPITVVRQKVTRLAKNEGYTIAELFGSGTPAVTRTPKAAGAKPTKSTKARKVLGKVAPKYRNTDNASETWTGRGKQPRWLAAHTSKGRKLDEFVIQ